MGMRVRCDEARLYAEADTLLSIARLFHVKGVVEGQQTLM
jgi:hypothetical protein